MPITKIVFATSNQKKIQELSAYAQVYAIPIQFTSQADSGVNEVEETGLSFVENAILKARHAARQTGLPAMADDSGLVVDALNGEPGIYSARYAGKNATDKQNIEKLLMTLKEMPAQTFTAQFHCALVYLSHANDPIPLICEGVWKGTILSNPQGFNGFGYDPIFYVPTHHCSAAELSIAEKNRISHRGQALKCLFENL